MVKVPVFWEEGKRRKLSILAIGAHPDDVEYSAGGTVAKYTKAGHKVTILNLTRGETASMTISSEELKRIRTEEGTRAARILGADVRFLDFPSHGFYPTRETILALVEVIREIKPDIAITHHPNEIHDDDRNAGKISIDAFVQCALPLIKTKSPAHSVKDLYMYGDPHRFTDPPRPTIYIDITDVIELKLQALKEHKSQIEWMREHEGYDAYFTDPIEEVTARARECGALSGTRYAEPFITLRPRALPFFP